MKKLLPSILLSIFATGASLTVMAQSIFTAAQYTPQINDHFKIKLGNYIAPGSPGANQTWNFASMAVTSNATNDYVSRAGAPFPANVPAANLVSKTSANEYQYLETIPTGIRTHGAYSTAQNMFITYSNPLDITFPMNYNVPVSDSYKATFTTNGLNFFRSGNTTFTYDGYGTVITPEGTFSNVIRLKIYDVVKDSANIGGGFPYVINTIIETYDYIQPGIRYPVARMVQATVGANMQSRGMYLDVTALGRSEDFATELDMQVYPNPASTETTFQYKLKAAGNVNIALVNMIGQEILVLKNGAVSAEKQALQIPVSNLPKGIYFVRLTTGNEVAMKRLVIQ